MQGKLLDFFSSKKKGAGRIEIESDVDSDSDYDIKKQAKTRAKTTTRASAISLSQDDVGLKRRVQSKSTKRGKSKRRRPFSMTKKRNDVLKLARQVTAEE